MRITKTADAAVVIADLMSSLHDLVQDEKCDHSVGICWCDQREYIERAARWLNKHSYGYLALHITKQFK